MGQSKIFTPLDLPNGTTIRNRIAKAAMEESLADVATSTPSKQLINLYATWAKGGSGVIITGHVMVDRSAMSGPGDVALDADSNLTMFQEWAAVSRIHGAQVWMQINHPGRQMRTDLGQQAYAPSAIPLDVGGASRLFCQPKEMPDSMVESVIERFVATARLAEEAGFNGVEVHAAHGYLISQFLSPLVNKRTDRWGGSPENRARVLYSVVRRIRAAVNPSFAVAVKINSADFQRGGFSPSDAIDVVGTLNTLGVDCIELSGGSYESPAMVIRIDSSKGSAYLEFAKEIVNVATVPIMLTGGISRRKVMEQVLDAGVAIVGLTTALALVPDLPVRLQRGERIPTAKTTPPNWSSKTLASAANLGVVKWNMRKHSKGEKATYQIWPIFAFIIEFFLGWRRARVFKQTRKVKAD
ncbi:hypothetical protein QFC21_002236 [Naganishia friedmannii]|uniref:Uncharacterized protein n=1 Tax=Naganishia friedmannii TaxID=89922 RepID=A0ACC2VXI9_9TREE|nr:hypothetical protein QFC21_002236 [Naganishia friedmannii]